MNMDKNDNVNYWNLGDIRLRAAEASDAPMFAGHFNDSPAWIERAFDKIDFPQTVSGAGHWLSGSCASPERAAGDDRRLFVIEAAGTGQFLGYIDVWEADSHTGVFRTGIKMLDGNAGKGYATRAFTRVLGYYFRELRYQKCGVYIYEFNEASLRFHKKLGFAEEGRLRRECYTGGRYYDSVLFGLCGRI